MERIHKESHIFFQMQLLLASPHYFSTSKRGYKGTQTPFRKHSSSSSPRMQLDSVSLKARRVNRAFRGHLNVRLEVIMSSLGSFPAGPASCLAQSLCETFSGRMKRMTSSLFHFLGNDEYIIKKYFQKPIFISMSYCLLYSVV